MSEQLSSSTDRRLHVPANKPPKGKDFGKTGIFRPEDFHLKPKHETPKERVTREQEEKRNHLAHFLDSQVSSLNIHIRSLDKRLEGNRTRTISKTMFDVPRHTDKKLSNQDIEAIEDGILGLKMQRDSLAETRNAVMAGKPIPADAKATLSILRQQKGRELQGRINVTEDPKHDDAVKDKKHQLEYFDAAMKDLGI